MVFYTILLTLPILTQCASKRRSECFTCSSNPNWDYYTERIEGLMIFNASNRPPLAPLSCIFDPKRIYADRTAVACNGKCLKWVSTTITADGGVKASILRGCYEKLIDVTKYPPSVESRCYQSPSDYNHQVDIEYTTTCYCNGFICNHSSSFTFSIIPLLILYLYL